MYVGWNRAVVISLSVAVGTYDFARINGPLLTLLANVMLRRLSPNFSESTNCLHNFRTCESDIVQAATKPQPVHELAPTAASASSPPRSMHSVSPEGDVSGNVGSVPHVRGGGSGGATLNAEVVAHLLRESADSRARIDAIEAALNKSAIDDDSKECFDVHVMLPAGHKTVRLIGVRGDE